MPKSGASFPARTSTRVLDNSRIKCPMMTGRRRPMTTVPFIHRDDIHPYSCQGHCVLSGSPKRHPKRPLTAHAEPILPWPECAWEGDFPHSLPKITIGVNDPISSRLHSLLLFLHGFLTPEHPQGELIHAGLHHGSKLPMHKPGLPGRGVYIVKPDHGFFPVPFCTHWVAVVFHVLAPHAIFQDRVLPLEHIIPIRFLLFVARERIGFVFHGGFRTCCLRVRRTGFA